MYKLEANGKGDTIWPLAHFFWGYSVTLPIFLLILWLVKRNIMVSNLREFIKNRAIVGFIGGIWAEIPDIDYLLEGTVFHTSDWSNIFFFHFSLDEILPETDLFFAAEVFLVFAAINLFALVASVESFKKLKEALFGKEEEEDEDEEDEEDEDGEKERGEDKEKESDEPNEGEEGEPKVEEERKEEQMKKD
jgi:hypothetical protein